MSDEDNTDNTKHTKPSPIFNYVFRMLYSCRLHRPHIRIQDIWKTASGFKRDHQK